MRIQSITETNTQQQYNPHIVQNIGHAQAVNNVSQISFEECLRSQIQDNGVPAMIRKTELWIANVGFDGYNIPQGVSLRPEAKHSLRDYKSLSEV